MSASPPIELIYLLAFCAAFLALQCIVGLGRQASLKVSVANERLRRMQKDDAQDVVVAKMKKARSLGEAGNVEGLVLWLNQLVAYSGLPLGPYGIYYALAGTSFALSAFAFIMHAGPIWILTGFVMGLILPIFILKYLVARRREKAVSQLPESLNIIVRSLAAGHPVPVSMGLVAREMPDPLGSEFSIASDEVSFGSSTSAAIQRLADRVGHDDFELFSAMIRLQERTGGNLAELLQSSAKTIKERQTMRLRIKACSAEGRVSALILNAAPLIMFLLIRIAAPDFYGDISQNPTMMKAFIGVAIWMVIGNLVMRRMINFKI